MNTTKRFKTLVKEVLTIPANAVGHDEIRGSRMSKDDDNYSLIFIDVDGSQVGGEITSTNFDLLNRVLGDEILAKGNARMVVIEHDAEKRRFSVIYNGSKETFDVYKDARYRAVEILADTIIRNTRF